MSSSSMVAEPSSISSPARCKLHSPVGGKGKCSLHRWVLLKNCMLHPLPLTTPSLTQSEPNLPHPIGGEVEEDEVVTEDNDSFMFPDAENLVEADAGEAQWLDSLLETLGDDDDSDFGGSSLQTDEDEDHPLSPFISPMSSSDDLISSAYDETPISSPYTYPYPVPYPPFHPPLVHSYDDDSLDSLDFSFLVSPHDNPFPFPHRDEDDVADMPVPDSIEDTSDDESDTPSTPSIGQSSSSLDFKDPATVALRDDGLSFGRTIPGIFINPSDSCLYPHPDGFRLSYIHQDC
ncbi:hypothetical protein V5O48_001748 [Marasmius crinis-equi]|uniref:Uncharacterized protein n=1 Tax=Marasmius crinis-equi TaxID=585013 RepID=A0ABR3FXI3_9AGAR